MFKSLRCPCKPNLAAVICALMWSVASISATVAQGNDQHDTSSAGGIRSAGASSDTLAAGDLRAQVMAFTNALDSVYTSINGTYKGIEPILREGCYDCHSGQTKYPWYYKIPGIRGMIDTDIQEGREHLDLDKGFPFGGRGSQEDHLLEMREEMAAGAMPLRSYKFLHWGAAPNEAERDTVFAWIDSSLASIQGVMKRFGVEPPDPQAPVVYICPMDPEVVSARPGTCPKCGMDLEELKRQEGR